MNNLINRIEIKHNAYFDSITLMMVRNKISKLAGIKQALVAMATPINVMLLENNGFTIEPGLAFSPNDLVIALTGESAKACDEAYREANDLIWGKHKIPRQKEEKDIYNLKEGQQLINANLAVISVAGQFAVRVAKEALENNMHVMLFSDNVTIEEELNLKRLAHEKGLIVMGPDCGTSVINDVGLCFANKVNRGKIGVIAASGTGMQEVCVLIHKFGGGISQAIGVGSRDLSETIGGITMIDSLKALFHDDGTEVIALISKPPSAMVAEKILDLAKECRKPIVVCFLGRPPQNAIVDNVVLSVNLEDAAVKAVQLLKGEMVSQTDASIYEAKKEARENRFQFKPCQKYIRGIFSGGTLALEAFTILSNAYGNVFSNVAQDKARQLHDSMNSACHSIIDMGDDRFTSGRLHPMIDPTVRNSRIQQEAMDEETAVLLLDFELGYGSPIDPVGAASGALQKALKTAANAGRQLAVVAYILGTELDDQNIDRQREALESLGVIVCESNLQAAKTAIEIVKNWSV